MTAERIIGVVGHLYLGVYCGLPARGVIGVRAVAIAVVVKVFQVRLEYGVAFRLLCLPVADYSRSNVVPPSSAEMTKETE